MSEFLGLYIDHQKTEPFAVAQHSAKMKTLATELAKVGILLLTTCVRVEAYGEKPALRSINSTLFSGFSYERIEGAAAIVKRLAEIASGAHSQILGESYISHQLVKTLEFIDPNLPIFKIARLGIDIGRAARERHRFFASFNYDQILQDIVADRFPDGERPDRLYVIGSGMLGLGLIGSGVGERFQSTVVVTRNPKNLRKRLRPRTDVEVALMRPQDIGDGPEPQSIVVIATADVDGEYESTLQSAILRLAPRVIVDLSSIPFLRDARKLNYVNMYKDEFLRFIEMNNEQLTPKLPLLFADIDTTLRTAQTYLPVNAGRYCSVI
ncbi:hypothetical protein [Rhizobium etli]|uniref:hypothetical protein n=1 Tax=Rhizobium etli TaxID=29449 RepID=UPI0003839101|nr:hypothetical protein [Rhizobium etli]AGS25301.1 glutamyl-tRNA reductase protein [Rhizobium etli bv. mimosae str. Mim1]